MYFNSQIKMKKNIKILILTLCLLFLNGFIFFIETNNLNAKTINQQYCINIDKATIKKGYTVNAFNNSLKLSLVPGILKDSTKVLIDEINEDMAFPWQFNKISKIYQFEFKNNKAYDNHKPFYIQFSYEESTNNHKQVYFYDKNFSSWRPLPTIDFPKEKFVRSLIHLPFARIAIFSNPEIMTIGKASWYGYKNGNFAASPDFSKGSKLRVYNNENQKYVDVEINDYGPNRKLFPNRVIDLDKIAFKKIASLGSGIIDVRIEPLFIANGNQEKILNASTLKATDKPIINAKSAIIIDENSEKVLFKKNINDILPIASLTKLIAVKVFLDTHPSLNKIVAYDIKDEEYNHQYCSKWESARIKLNNGDKITINDLLYASLVSSANNAIESLVRVSGLPRNEFIKKMNETVKSWGAESTYFIEPTGLSPKNVSSAFDYSIITKKIFINPLIKKISSTLEYEFQTINTNKKFKIKNSNKLIKKFEYNFVGSKTGYLNEAGYCLMSRVKLNNGKHIIIVILGNDTQNINFNEMDQLIKYGEKNNK